MNQFKKTGLTFLTAIFCLLSAKAQQSVKQPVDIQNLKVYEKNNKQIVEWATGATPATNYWELQSSADSTTFTTIALVLGDDPTNPGTYKVVNGGRTVNTAKRYYRVSYIHKDGTIQNSKIIESAK